jgi:hypothetical protein
LQERKIPTGITFPKKTLEVIDRVRGQVPRSTFVVDILEEKLKITVKGEGKS